MARPPVSSPTLDFVGQEIHCRSSASHRRRAPCGCWMARVLNENAQARYWGGALAFTNTPTPPSRWSRCRRIVFGRRQKQPVRGRVHDFQIEYVRQATIQVLRRISTSTFGLNLLHLYEEKWLENHGLVSAGQHHRKRLTTHLSAKMCSLRALQRATRVSGHGQTVRKSTRSRTLHHAPYRRGTGGVAAPRTMQPG